MKDYWNELGGKCVGNCIERDMPITALYVQEIVLQRTELLKALKMAKSRIEDLLEADDGQAYKEARKALPYIDSAISKAESME